MFRAYRLVMASALLALSACSASDRAGLWPTAAGPDAALDSRVLVRLHETLSPSTRTLHLVCVTEKEYSSSNLYIDHRVRRSGGGIGIEFLGIRWPAVATAMVGPARAEIDLGALAPGSYPISFQTGTVQQRATLEVTDVSYRLNPSSGEGPVVLPDSTLMRVPKDSIWGWIGYWSGSQGTLAEEFLLGLEQRGAVVRLLSDGDYEYFDIGPDGRIETPPYYYRFMKAYLYGYSGPARNLQDLMVAFDDSLDIELYSDRGDHIMSWAPNQ